MASSHPAVEPDAATAALRLRTLLGLGRRLNSAASFRRAGEMLAEAADELLSWDACSLGIYFPETDTMSCLYEADLIDGHRKDVTPITSPRPPSAQARQVIANGAQILLRTEPRFTPDVRPFGDERHPSASLLYAPLRFQKRVLGVFTIQSYRSGAYSRADLELLQNLLDFAGGAFERIESQRQLQRTEELYRRAIGGAGAVPYAYDYRTRTYTFMGDGIEALTGYGPDEISGEVWARITQESAMRGEAAGLDKAEAARRVKAGELRTWRCDMRILTRAGKSRWISDASVQNLDTNGKPIGSMGILEDITERKRAEVAAETLSRVGQRLLTATDAPAVAHALVTAADELFHWDACAIYIYSPATGVVEPLMCVDTVNGERKELDPSSVGSPSAAELKVLNDGAELIITPAAPPGASATHPVSHPRAQSSAAVMRVPMRMRTRDCTGIVIFRSYTSRDYSQQDLQTLQILADGCGVALERIRADEALRESESQFRLVWEGSADGMRLTNREGIILRVNESYCRMVRKARAELEGHPIRVTLSSESGEPAMDTYRQRLATGTMEQHREVEVTLWNGDHAWFGLSNSLLEKPGRPLLVLTVFRDITQRKQDEALLEQMHRQLLVVSHQAGMAEVATSVLHNVGNVLNSVNVSTLLIESKLRASKARNLGKVADMLLARTGDLANYLSTDTKGKELPGYLCSLTRHLADEHEEVLKELQSLAGNVGHIRDIVARQQSYATVSGLIETLPISDLVEDALRLNADKVEQHNIVVTREFAPVPPMPVDKHKVLQILVNLIRNAEDALMDSAQPHKRLTLRIEPSRRQTVQVSVSDNGMGIAPENLTRIFQHGFTTRQTGHGFGLHNSALAAREMGGSLTAHSEGPGRGATFVLELPSAPAA